MSESLPEPPRRSNAHLINRIRLVKGDITRLNDIGAIVSTINIDMNIQGSLNQAVAAAAGEKLDAFILENIYKPRCGDAFAVPGFNLPVKHIIYVVTPAWKSGLFGEDRDLLHCYRHAMDLAYRMGLSSLAFPALGTGRDKFPVAKAARLGVQGIMERLTKRMEEVRIVCNRDETCKAFHERLVHEGWKENKA